MTRVLACFCAESSAFGRSRSAVLRDDPVHHRHKQRRDNEGQVGAGSLKIKVAASIVAISSIHLLKAFMNYDSVTTEKMLILQFFRELIHIVEMAPTLVEVDLILMALTLIDLTLVASLVVMVMLSGYENFVSKLDLDGAERPRT
jgi:uncharacterized membrane protein YqhA